MELGVHELATMTATDQPEQTYDKVKDFVRAVESFNYKRYWFAEHHNVSNHISSSPELMAAYMAAISEKIRVGTGGTMLMNYSPLKVAENFKTLTTLAPGRIDLGLGRAPGGGRAEIIALAQGHLDSIDDQYGKIQVILDLLEDKKASGIYGATNASPQGTATLPEPWMLGSSGQSALKAAQMGLGYSFAKFFGIATDPAVFQAYRDNFQASQFFEKPSVMVSYMIVVGDSPEEADYLAKPLELNQIRLRQGQMIRVQDPESLIDYSFSPHEQAQIDKSYRERFLIKGDMKQVESILSQEIEAYGIDEIMVYAPLFDYQDRVQSYRRLAQIFNKI
ncbi:MsnO8 family LLM class oxidoreductase [Hutsoniella sourekii]|uniref:MsnO8 family LLM class oxidoreductase n=1 Tax=Hutsoniella sourekii TaxID=87650 RepID=UPI0004805E00|nr:MsnO8 family LLM class oxidoreductase [Hutsoniella sourekii]